MNPGGTMIDPMLAPAKKPSADPMEAETRAGTGPISIPTTNMIMGANVRVESGGGIGTAVIVVTAIKADITAVIANFTVALD